MSSTRPPSYDERFVVPVEASRRGAHRARVSPAFAFLPYVAIAAVVLGVGALAWTLVGSSLFGGSAGSGAQAGGGGVSSTPSLSRSATPSGSATSPSASPSSSTSPSGSATQTTGTKVTIPAGIDRTVAITVLNGSSPTFATRAGLAARGTAKLVDAGWSAAVVSKKSATSAGITVVYYGRTELKEAAQAVVASLGVGKARYSPAKAGRSIVVIMSDDYTA